MPLLLQIHTSLIHQNVCTKVYHTPYLGVLAAGAQASLAAAVRSAEAASEGEEEEEGGEDDDEDDGDDGHAGQHLRLHARVLQR